MNDESPVCAKCGCKHFRTVGRRRYCQRCPWSTAIRVTYRGPRCESCGGKLTQTNTDEWKDGQRERRFICENQQCKAYRDPIETVETQKSYTGIKTPDAQ